MQRIKISLLFLFIFLICVPSAYAMHIAEGMLTYKWALSWWLLAVPFIIVGLNHIKKLKQQNSLYLPLLSTTAAALFVFSMLPIPVPITGTTSHPTAAGLSGLLVGVLPTAVISFISLFIQAIFLGHGGISTLGANLVSMGIAGSSVAVFIFYLLKRLKVSLGIRVFMAGFLADIATYIVTSFQLAVSLVMPQQALGTFLKFVILFIPIQLPIAILEGVVTVGIIKYISVHRPAIIEHLL